MAEYIDRAALIEWLKRIRLIDLSDGRGLCRVIMEDDFKKAIKKMPKGIIADVSPVRHGRWVGDSFCKWQCNKCHAPAPKYGYPVSEFVRSSYCPNCGTDMRGSNDE